MQLPNQPRGESDSSGPVFAVSNDMAELIHECEHMVGEAGETYRARVFGEPRRNLWVAWIEFTGRNGSVRRTGEETSQPDREAVVYWASGLEPVFLEGALARAK